MGSSHSEHSVTVQVLNRPQNVTFINTSNTSGAPAGSSPPGRTVAVSPEAAVGLLTRSVTVEITNATSDVTLQDPRTYCFSGYSSTPPSPRIPPGATECCRFYNSLLRFRGSVGLLVYEAETFTLAILFSNPFDYNLYCIELAVEISSRKVHRGSLRDTYTRLYQQAENPNWDTAFRRLKLRSCQESLAVSAGHVRVMATMSNSRSSIIKVVVMNEAALPPKSQGGPISLWQAVGSPEGVDKPHPRC